MLRATKVFLCLALLGASLLAQSTAQIQGSVQDASGAAVPGAEVKATQTQTGALRTVTSGADGGYVLANLPIGPYRVEVSRAGFSTYVQTGIVLQVASSPSVDITLKVGGVSDQVQVEANAALVETERTGIGNVIENQRIIELPLNGRNVNDLITLSGAAIPVSPGGGYSIPGSVSIVVAGGQTSGVSYWMDGALYNNPADGTGLPFPFPDALQEFKVETSSLNAQNGVHAGASVNAVSKTGTNGYHGDVFEFLRNGAVNGRNFFSPIPDNLKRNQFGGTFGAPIQKDKLFYFVGYQDTKVSQFAPAPAPGFVATADMMIGDFSKVTAPGCNNGTQLKLAAPFSSDNRIDPLTFSPAAVKIAKTLPTTSDACGRVLFGAPTKNDTWQVLGRVDYQLSAKHNIFGRYMNTAFYQQNGYALTKNILATALASSAGRNSLATAVAFGSTYLVSSTVVNSFRASFNRTANSPFQEPYYSACDEGVKITCFLPGNTNINVGGGSMLIGGCCVINTTLAPTTYQLGDDISLVRGAHQFTFGYTQYQYRSSTVAYVFAQGNWAFNGSATQTPGQSGLGWADFLIGKATTFTQSSPNTLLTRKNYVSLYAQDTWKITSHLTANYGVRWEPFIPQTMTNGAVYNFDMAKFNAGTKSSVFTNAPSGLRFPGDDGFAGNAGMNHQWNLFAPRLGLAWDPKGDGKMVIRASYGLAYDFVSAAFYANTATAPPFANTTTIRGVKFDDPWASIPGGNFFPYAFGKSAPFAAAGTYIALKPDAKATTVNQWNFAIQRQFGKDWLATATYVGSGTAHLWQTYQLNPAPFIPGNCVAGQYGLTAPGACSSAGNINQRRIFSQLRPADGNLIGYMDQFTDGGTASYNGLLLSLQKRLSRSISMSANYTWSHCIGDETQTSGVGGSAVGYTDINNRRFDRSNCDSRQIAGSLSADRRQIFNLTTVAQSPRFANNTARTLASGWKLAVIYRATSSYWLTAYTNGDRQLSGQNNQRANQVLSDPLCANPGPDCWINPAAYGVPALGTLGTSGKANIPGPKFFQLDNALSRDFRVHEGVSLEFRAEAFNLTNSFRAGNSGNGLSGVVTTQVPTFGKITSALDPRILQFAMKVVF